MVKPFEVDTADSFHTEVLEEPSRPVVVYFWSATCPTCSRMTPEVEAAAESSEGIKFVKAAAPALLELFKEYRVRATPSLVLCSKGQEVARQEGFKTAAEIIGWVNEHV